MACPVMLMTETVVLVITIPVVGYLGMAVSVALFHPNERRRRDAIAVLRCLTALLRKPKSPK